ncbi:MAG: hypothetical protein EON54_05505 [Alcaligenaceae bacterium]|nr:MAG: hypothetical protein EON54_05505 [Alcaligenaceae bacterium]
MAIRWRSVFFLALFAATGSVIAQTGHALPSVAHVGTCPAFIEVQQTPIGELPPGWQAVGSTKKHYLNNVSFYYGSPDPMAILAPDSEQRRGKTLTSTWPLTPQDLLYWVGCEYGRTAAIVAKPLDKNLTSCSVQHDLRNSPITLVRWSCRSGGS